MSELTNIISLVMGDWSHDGHSKSDTYNVSSNLDKRAMKIAYKKASKKLGFDLTEDVAQDYEDHYLVKNKLDILVKHGLETKKLNLDYDLKRKNFEEDDPISLYHDDFLKIYLFIVRLGDPEFRYELLDDDVSPTIHIGGYGLYE